MKFDRKFWKVTESHCKHDDVNICHVYLLDYTSRPPMYPSTFRIDGYCKKCAMDVRIQPRRP